MLQYPLLKGGNIMEHDKLYLRETPSQAVCGVFRKKRKTFKIPKLKHGTYVISPELVGGAYAYGKLAIAVTFTEFLEELDDKTLRKLYGKQSLINGKLKNKNAKIVLDFDGVFKEHFTGKEIYALPYNYVETLNPSDPNKDKVDVFIGETERSLRENNIDSAFIHLEDVYVPKAKELGQIFKLYESKNRLAIFETQFLNFVNDSETLLASAEGNKQYLRLKRKEKQIRQ